MKDVFTSVFLVVALILGIVLMHKGMSGNSHLTISNIEQRIDSLQKHSDSLARYIGKKEDEMKILIKKVDSLQSLKPAIQIKYVNKYKEIDNASVGAVVNEFDSIFTKGIGK